jgi:hypothetical protein
LRDGKLSTPEGRVTCDGWCDRRNAPGHVGPVRRVVVSLAHSTWSREHWYCETAIAEDRATGFTVTYAIPRAA